MRSQTVARFFHSCSSNNRAGTSRVPAGSSARTIASIPPRAGRRPRSALRTVAHRPAPLLSSLHLGVPPPGDVVSRCRLLLSTRPFITGSAACPARRRSRFVGRAPRADPDERGERGCRRTRAHADGRRRRARRRPCAASSPSGARGPTSARCSPSVTALSRAGTTGRASRSKVWIQPEQRQSTDGARRYATRVRDAFLDWDALAPPVRFAFTADSASADVHVTFIDHFNEPISGRTKWARDDDWWIIDADIVLAVHHRNGRDARRRSDERAWRCTRSATCSASITPRTRRASWRRASASARSRRADRRPCACSTRSRREAVR